MIMGVIRLNFYCAFSVVSFTIFSIIEVWIIVGFRAKRAAMDLDKDSAESSKLMI
jgi:hypothetical protein